MPNLAAIANDLQRIRGEIDDILKCIDDHLLSSAYSSPRPPARVADIIRSVASKHGVTIVDIKSRRRAKYIVRARHEAIFLVCKTEKYSYPEIGKFFERDHTTVMHAVKSHQRYLEKHDEMV